MITLLMAVIASHYRAPLKLNILHERLIAWGSDSYLVERGSLLILHGPGSIQKSYVTDHGSTVVGGCDAALSYNVLEMRDSMPRILCFAHGTVSTLLPTVPKSFVEAWHSYGEPKTYSLKRGLIFKFNNNFLGEGQPALMAWCYDGKDLFKLNPRHIALMSSVAPGLVSELHYENDVAQLSIRPINVAPNHSVETGLAKIIPFWRVDSKRFGSMYSSFGHTTVPHSVLIVSVNSSNSRALLFLVGLTKGTVHQYELKIPKELTIFLPGNTLLEFQHGYLSVKYFVNSAR